MHSMLSNTDQVLHASSDQAVMGSDDDDSEPARPRGDHTTTTTANSFAARRARFEAGEFWKHAPDVVCG